MRTVMLADAEDFDGWRDAARALALAGVPAAEVVWQVGETPTDLFGDEAPPEAIPGAFSVPRPFVALAKEVVSHADPARFALLYAFLLRLRREPGLIADAADPARRKLEDMAKAVRRDIHKMRAFVRFREIDEGDGPRFVAWFEPEHHIVRANSSFFVRRFANMRWSILAPELSIHWDGKVLSEAPGATKADAPDGDPLEEMWKTYYASIFNPARLMVGAMLKEMPKKYWKNMPETALVPSLIAGAQARTTRMIEIDMARRPTVQDDDDARYGSLAEARDAALGCTRCHLYKEATQTVFGEGPDSARLMFVGEQPGDQEDLAGHPFVGPAGQKFNEGLALAGIDRADTYVTNAVKHFKFVRRGKRRIHQSPEAPEIVPCNHWLREERRLVKPALTVALGGTAARALFGKAVTIGKARGAPATLADGTEAWVTVHPSYLLRVPPEDAPREFDRFVQDLIGAKERLAALAAGTVI